VKIEPTTVIIGLDEYVLTNQKIYPNPVSNTLFLSESANHVQVFDVNGKLVLQQQNKVKQVDVSQLNKGIYFIDMDGIKSKFSIQ
jgi:hypothetical protein